jgi:4'-phosphopantetheinyl transferase
LNNDVYLWHVNLDRSAREVIALRQILSQDERERASRMRAPGLENRYIVCRATLRLVLARRLSRQPDALRFDYSAAGKPELADVATHRVHFNVTHSRDAAKIALCEGTPLGIDLEYVRPDFATTEVAERFFSNAERIALREVPKNEKAVAFFRCWTRKEAFVKAIGTGIGFPLDQFDVSIDAESPDALLAVRNDEGATRRWLVRDLPAEPDFAAALAVARTSGKILTGEPIG